MERAVIQSSADIRTAESDPSIFFARVVLPAPGSPQMMKSVVWKSMGFFPPKRKYSHGQHEPLARCALYHCFTACVVPASDFRDCGKSLHRAIKQCLRG